MIEYYDKVVILTKSDGYISLEDWQNSYGLKVGTAQIGKHFSFTEPKFMEDLKRYGKLVVCAPLMVVLDKYRELSGEPVNINSFNRDAKKQEELHAEGLKAAMISPHVEKMAADCDTLSIADTFEKVDHMIQAGIDTGISIRIGYKQYLAAGQTFIHVDVCPLYYGKGMPREHEPHPVQWETKRTW